MLPLTRSHSWMILQSALIVVTIRNLLYHVAYADEIVLFSHCEARSCKQQSVITYSIVGRITTLYSFKQTFKLNP